MGSKALDVSYQIPFLMLSFCTINLSLVHWLIFVQSQDP